MRGGELWLHALDCWIMIPTRIYGSRVTAVKEAELQRDEDISPEFHRW